jgi:hypothetical protein
MRPVPTFIALQIARYPGEESCYVFYFAKDGVGTDTFHESLEEALSMLNTCMVSTKRNGRR